ncbi:MAG: alpha/beta hydrolase [Deltaproteobacteria bacterium]|nr:alpha/beta hydrolase [Deltaproteobacteria bacterium]
MHQIIARDGTRIGYTVHGGGGPAVVLSNGIGCNEVFLRYLTEDLSRKFRVINWHYRGHMTSAVPADLSHTDIPHLIDDLKLVLDDAGVTTAVFAGFSMGVEVNLEFLRRHPGMVSALVMICGPFEHCMKTFFHTPLLHHLYPLVLRAARKDPATFDRVWRLTIGGPLAFPCARVFIFNCGRVKRSDFLDYHPHITNIDKRLITEMAGYLTRHSARDLLPEVRVPTLIIAGTRDSFTPIRVCREMARMIPGARLVEIQGGSHGTPIEFPDQMNPSIVDFIEKLPLMRY